eukprot:9004145-Alexandrium_andersonii.AAC.1
MRRSESDSRRRDDERHAERDAKALLAACVLNRQASRLLQFVSSESEAAQPAWIVLRWSMDATSEKARVAVVVDKQSASSRTTQGARHHMVQAGCVSC